MKQWKRVCPLDEIALGTTLAIELADEELLICRVGEDEVFAVENVCTHDDGALDDGPLDGAVIECPRHGARFDVRDGRVERLPASAPLTTFPARIGADHWIEVELEER
ncbi:MAG: non-heme iron oxygenase ferredoxin subunit [bacterium]